MKKPKPDPNYLRLLTSEELCKLGMQTGLYERVRAEFFRRNGIAAEPKACAPELKPKRRMGRGKFVSVDDWSRRYDTRSAETDPEATRSTDQTLTELSLKGANSDGNAAILHDREKVADRLAHILSRLSTTHRKVIQRVLDVVEPGDSICEIARKAGFHATQVSRAFEKARLADKLQIFKQASRERRPPAISYTPYNPRGVSMEAVMMQHQGSVLSRLSGLNVGKVIGGQKQADKWLKRYPVRKAFIEWRDCPCLRAKPGATEPCEKCKENKAIWKRAMKNGPNQNPKQLFFQSFQ